MRWSNFHFLLSSFLVISEAGYIKIELLLLMVLLRYQS